MPAHDAHATQHILQDVQQLPWQIWSPGLSLIEYGI